MTIPSLPVIGSFSNYDGEIPEAEIIAAAMRGEGLILHPAYDHCGYIWYFDGKWHEATKVYGVLRDVFVGDTIECVWSAANEEYGAE